MSPEQAHQQAHKHEFKRPWSGTEQVWGYYNARGLGLPFPVTRRFVNNLEDIARDPQNARRDVIVVNQPQDDDSKRLTIAQIAEVLTGLKIDNIVALAIAQDLRQGCRVSIVSGYIDGPFAAVLDWGNLDPESYHSAQAIRLGRGAKAPL